MFLNINVKGIEKEFIEVMPGEQHGNGPGNTSDNIKEHELFLIHANNAGNDGCKSPDNGQKPCKDDGPATMFIIKFLRRIKMFLFKEESILSLEKIGSAFCTEPITTVLPSTPANDTSEAISIRFRKSLSCVKDFRGQFIEL